jgi:hypothetical protein
VITLKNKYHIKMLKQIDYSTIPEADVVVDFIEARKRKGLYSLILTSGLPGTGKSSIDLRLAELISLKLTGKNIITEENIIDDILPLIRFLKNAREDEVCIAIVEEISVLFPSRRAMSHDNVVIGKLLDTARKKQVILLANAPLWPSIDSHIRALGNIYLETLRINKKEGVVICKPLRLQTNPGTGKTYFHRLKRSGKDVHRIIFRRPNTKTWAGYELKKDKFIDELYEDLKNKTLKKRGKPEEKKVVRPITPLEMKIYDLVVRKGMTQAMAGKELGIAQKNVCKVLQNLKKKMNFEENPIERQKFCQRDYKTKANIGDISSIPPIIPVFDTI